jgi:hypothetical protein
MEEQRNPYATSLILRYAGIAGQCDTQKHHTAAGRSESASKRVHTCLEHLLHVVRHVTGSYGHRMSQHRVVRFSGDQWHRFCLPALLAVESSDDKRLRIEGGVLCAEP